MLQWQIYHYITEGSSDKSDQVEYLEYNLLFSKLIDLKSTISYTFFLKTYYKCKVSFFIKMCYFSLLIILIKYFAMKRLLRKTLTS